MIVVCATPDRLYYISEATKDGDHYRRWVVRARFTNYRTDYTECRDLFRAALPMGDFETPFPGQFDPSFVMKTIIRSSADGCQAYLYGKYGELDVMVNPDSNLEVAVRWQWRFFPDAKAAALAIVENWEFAYQEAVRRADKRQSEITDLAVQQKDYDDALAAQIAALHETNLLAPDQQPEE